jgi:hypothetical protein
MGVKSPLTSSAIISRHLVIKGPNVDPDVDPDVDVVAVADDVSVRTVTGVQFTPSAEYAIV